MIESLDHEKCIACGTCIKVCPRDVFRMNEEEVHSEVRYRDDCQTCYTCELDCPAHAIRVLPWRKPRAQAW
ncbi:MAG TPA: ferredoxin family protein [bacterium]|nr:ferredoxin family protein [bacterium]